PPARALPFSLFRVTGIARPGHHRHIGAGNVARLMADKDARTETLQALGAGRLLEIGARDLIAEIKQHFGDPAHAHPADTDEMNAADAAHTPNFCLHGSWRLSHWPPPGRYRPRYGWHRAGLADVQRPPWSLVFPAASLPRSAARPARQHLFLLEGEGRQRLPSPDIRHCGSGGRRWHGAAAPERTAARLRPVHRPSAHRHGR